MRWKQLFQKAKVRLINEHPFFAQVMLQLKVVEDEVSTDRMATDGYRLFVNPKAIEREGWSVDETMAVLAHECMHILGMHHIRRESRDWIKWNIATDAVINITLEEAGFVLPGNRVDFPWAKDLSAEEVYNRLPEDKKELASLLRAAMDGAVKDAPLETGAGAEGEARAAEEARVKQMAVNAATVAKMAGKLPGFAKEFVDELLNPKLDWRQQLRKYMHERARDDYTWMRPNRRFISGGLYLPTLDDESRMGKLTIALDTSESIADEELREFLNELRGIIDAVRPTQIEVLWFTTRVERRETFDEPRSFDISPEVRFDGGTDVRCVFEELRDTNVLVVFSDMETPFPDESFVDTLWVASSDASSNKPSFGTYVRIEP